MERMTIAQSRATIDQRCFDFLLEVHAALYRRRKFKRRAEQLMAGKLAVQFN